MRSVEKVLGGVVRTRRIEEGGGRRFVRRFGGVY